MKINEYQSGDIVEVKVNNPQLDNRLEWREGEVIGIQMIYPNAIGGTPYPMATIKFKRTYCKTTPKYKWLEGTAKKVKVFVDNILEFYTKQSTEGFYNKDEVRLKNNS